ncbi:autotransporter domain-containing protein [Aliarcobacter cibarius]|uniref:Autotransporter domain-containing protein n=4 Tax=Aliarcobacter cibarius TaxID=255507 RepID=A0A7L5JQC1_9BACT|nr:autotransporter domain-containing protein [Aliarcobacter cibarius]QKJ27453.1 autotransporter domain-containing protein [Aliarcobacter cibarius]
MSSFRVQNARFRILKGGKIGLCLSIALLSSVISPTSLFSADYFTGVQATVTPTTATGTGSGNNYSLTVEQANNVSNTLLNQNVSNTSTLTDDIVFKPTSWATSSYTNPIFAPTYTNAYGTTIPDRFNVNKTIDKPLILNLTFDSFANANNIYKDTSSTLFYQGISQPAGYVVASVSNPTLNLSTNNSTNYTANIIMSGNNTVAGNIDIGSDGNINIIGSNVEFKGNVTAGNTDISNGATLNSLGNITSNINGTTANSGTLNMNGSSQTVTGNIGNTNSLQNFNVTSGTTTLTGNLNATNTNISNGATLNSQGNITSNVNGATANSGNLVTSGTNQLVTGNIGDTNSLQNFNVISGITTLNGNLTSTNTDITNNSTLKISDGKTITSTILSSDATGNLTLLGNGTIFGTIGNSANSLSSVNAGATGTISTFNGDIYSKDTNIVGDGTVNLNQDLIGTNLTFNANGIVNSIADISAAVVGTAGTLNMNGTTQTITGNVGAINNLNITNGTTTLNGNLNATNTNISNGATLNSQGNITSNINGTTANSGNLVMSGLSQTITGDIGNTKSLQNFNITNGTTKLTGNLNAVNTNISNGTTLNSLGNITSNINGTTANSGTLSMSGTNQTITGNIGNTNSLQNFNVTNGTTTLNGNLNATNTNISNGTILNSLGNITSNINGKTANSGTLNMNGTTQTITGNIGDTNSLENFNVTNGTTTLNGNLNATNTNISNGASLNSQGNITSNVNGTAANSGNLLMSGANQTIFNSIGNIYSLNNFTVKTGTTTANADIKALSTNIANGATLNLKANIVSNIDGDTPNSGTLSMSGVSQTVTGDIGSINKLSNFVVNSGATTLNGNLSAINTNIGTNATLNSLGNITSNINGTGLNTGTLNMTGTTQTIIGNVGTINNLNITNGTTTLNGNLNAANTNISNGATLNSLGNITSNINGTGLNTGTLNMNGTTQTITGNVGAINNLNITNGTTTLNGNLNATNTNISNGATLNSQGNITSNINGTTANSGNLVMSGLSQTITGDIGNTKSLQNFNITNGTTKLTGNLNAVNTNISNGTTLNSLGNITSNINGTTANSGTLSMSGTNQTITGNIGNTNSLQNFNVTNGTTTLNGNLNATNTNISNGTILNSLGNITSNINGKTANSGTLNMNGTTQTITGNIGDTNSLENFNVTNGTTTLNGNLNATNTNISNGASLNSQGNITSNVNGTAANSGNLLMSGANQTIFNSIGNIYSLNNFTVKTGTTTANADIKALSTNIANGATLNLKANIVSNIDGDTPNSGTLSMSGVSQTVTGDIGSINKLSNFVVNSGATTLNGNLSAINTNIGTNATLNSLGNITTNLFFDGNGVANLYEGITGDINFAGNDGVVNVKDEKNVDGNISTLANNTGTINFEGDSQVSGTIGDIAFGVKNINVNTNNQQDKDPSGNVLSGSGLFIHRDIYADRINLQNNATLILDDGADITNTNLPDLIVMTTDANNKGNVIFAGTSNIKGQIGENLLSLESITAGETGSILTFENKVYVKDLNYKSDGDVILKDELKGNIVFKATQGTLTLSDGVNLNTSNTTFEDANSAKLIFAGDSTINGTLGGNTTGKSTFATIEAGAAGKTVTFQNNLYATNLEITGDEGIVNLNGNFTGNNINYQDDGIINLADKKAINSSITTNDEYGTLNLLGDSSINGTIGTIDNKLKEINSAQNSKTSNLNGNTFAKDLNVGTGILNLNGNFTGDNLNYEANGVVNLADNKVVDSKILTTTDNQGILNTLKNAEFKQQIGQDGKKLKDINTAKSDSTTTFKEDVYAQNLNLQENGTVNLGGNFKGDKIDFKDNATLNIAKDKNISSKIVSQDENIGEINIAGSTIISGEIADSLNKIRAIKLNGKNSSSTFEKDTFVKDLNLNEKLTLNLNGNLEAENLNYNSDATINLANQKNIDAKINTLNNGEGTLNLLGSSNINKKVGSDTNRLKEIKTGASGSTSEFKDNVYANKTTIKDEGTVNFKENLYSNIYFGGNGTVNIEDNKAVISQTQPFTTTIADGVGNLNYKGATTLTNDIGSIDKRLNTVKFASDANRENIEQKLAYDVYAKNTVIGNGSNKVLIDFVDDVKFAGNLNIKDGATLNIKDKKLDVKDNIKVDKNSTLNFDVQTTDLSSGSAVVGGKSGQITADSLTMESDAKFNITYDGTWEGKGQYNLIVTQNDIDTKYRATEESGFVRDNSIIDSTVEVVGKNLVLKADRTTDGSHKAEDLYIVKSGIGNDYSNGASQSLAKLANEKAREGALAKIIRDIEYLEDGKTITSTKKQEMIDIQRKLAPNPSGVVNQNIADASNINKTSIKGRLNEMRTSNIEDSIQAYEGKGLSSGDSYTVGDSTLWLKTTASKTKQDDVGVYEGFNTKSYGFVAGLDKNVGDSSIIGISTSYMDTKATQNSHQTDTNSIGVSLYGSKEFELGYIEGQLNYTQHSSDTSRTANSGDLTSKVKADEMGARIEAGVHIPVDNGAYITPYAGVEYSQVNQKGYTEKGTSYQNDALKVDKYKEDKTTAEVGIKATSRIELDNALIIPQVSFAVAKDFGTSNPEIKAQFVGGGDKFVTPSRKPDDMIYKVGVGVEARITNDTKIRFDLNYDRSKDGDFEGYSGNVTLGISF